MQLIIQNNRVAGTATDAYTGPDEHMAAPEGFDIARMGEYVVAAGMVVLAFDGVPQTVTMRQARLALLAAGLLDDVEAGIVGAGTAAKIEWEYAQTVDRTSGLVPAMATALGMTELQIDALFISAGSL